LSISVEFRNEYIVNGSWGVQDGQSTCEALGRPDLAAFRR
jgi:hypothetical protein